MQVSFVGISKGWEYNEVCPLLSRPELDFHFITLECPLPRAGGGGWSISQLGGLEFYFSFTSSVFRPVKENSPLKHHVGHRAAGKSSSHASSYFSRARLIATNLKSEYYWLSYLQQVTEAKISSLFEKFHSVGWSTLIFLTRKTWSLATSVIGMY